jgi:starch synthase
VAAHRTDPGWRGGDGSGHLPGSRTRRPGSYYDYPEHFRLLMLNGMRYDYSWKHPGRHYVEIYDYIRDK